ncbi:hypothetical protein EA462_10720 [Natrarchaeobius halalkaliphilus]|uniref:Uncharacterized protein n=1 Tax=Natrarchaeobius halalkaliphilus TaxID=1679091 RepID=A0A3N6LPP5_9EURY|nr:hypothetical protein EA462_10720 [Natrarchaeobius halalkaliphilus]
MEVPEEWVKKTRQILIRLISSAYSRLIQKFRKSPEKCSVWDLNHLKTVSLAPLASVRLP